MRFELSTFLHPLSFTSALADISSLQARRGLRTSTFPVTVATNLELFCILYVYFRLYHVLLFFIMYVVFCRLNSVL